MLTYQDLIQIQDTDKAERLVSQNVQAVQTEKIKEGNLPLNHSYVIIM